MFEGQLSIFGDLFDTPAAPAAKKKDEKKKSAAKKSANNTKKEVNIKLPATVSLMGFEARYISPKMMGKEEVTGSELIKYVKETESWLPDAISYSEEMKAVIFTGTTQEKGEVKEPQALWFGLEELSIDQIPEEKRRDISEYIKAFREQRPDLSAAEAGIYTGCDGQLYVIINPKQHVSSIVMPKEELKIQYLFGETIVLSRAECVPLCGLENEAEVLPDTEIRLEELKKVLPEWLRAGAVFIRTGEDTYLVAVKEEEKQSAVKAKTYNIRGGATISLYFIKYPITPEDFTGKEEVEEEDIRQFLVLKGHVEYGFMESSIVVSPYSDPKTKEKYLLVTTRGSKKGACHPFFGLTDEGFHWNGPKIPLYIFGQFCDVAILVYRQWNTEILMELFYYRGEYFWYIPFQTVTSGSAESEAELFIESSVLSGAVKVGEWHSHGRIPAFFSSVDNEDEKFPGIYGVMGGIGTESPNFMWRVVGVGGIQKTLPNEQLSEVLDETQVDEPDPEAFQRYTIQSMDNIKRGRNRYPEYASEHGRALCMSRAIAEFWSRFGDSFTVKSFSPEGKGVTLLATPGFDPASARKTGAFKMVSDLVVGG